MTLIIVECPRCDAVVIPEVDIAVIDGRAYAFVCPTCTEMVRCEADTATVNLLDDVLAITT